LNARQKKNTELNEEIDMLSTSNKSILRDYTYIKNKFLNRTEQDKSIIEGLQKELNAATETYKAATDKIRMTYEKDLESKQQMICNLETESKSQKVQLDQQQQEIQHLRTLNSNLMAKNEQLESELTTQRQQYNALQNDHATTVTAHSKTTEDLQRRLREQACAINQAKDKKIRRKRKIEELTRENTQLHDKIKKIKKASESFQAIIEDPKQV
jgi:chromosome segregation ATPase